MKKLLALIVMFAMGLSLVACGGKKEPSETEEPSSQQQTIEETTEETSEEQTAESSDQDPVDNDPVEYGREYWEEQYPGENICPFFIEENGVEFSYYWVSGMDGYDGTIESWLDQPFNWNGWHKTADGCIVNEDETLKITDDWANGDESMSSFCTITTEPYVPGASETDDEPETEATSEAPQNDEVAKINGGADEVGIYSIVVRMTDQAADKGVVEMVYYGAKGSPQEESIVNTFRIEYYKEDAGTFEIQTFFNGEVYQNQHHKDEVKVTNTFDATLRAGSVIISYTPDGGESQEIFRADAEYFNTPEN